MAGLKNISCTSPRQLLEHLSPLDKDTWPVSQFIFRGQPDADLPLEPSAYRMSGFLTAPARYGTNDISVCDQIIFEIETLKLFLEGCDASGLVVPGDSPSIRANLKSFQPFLRENSLWPPPELHQLIAVAQHSGIPTCLLDWSKRSYVAAYFAASSALHYDFANSATQQLAVWALDVSNTDLWKGASVIMLPGGTNGNLAAQAGCFTVTQTSPEESCFFLPMALNAHTRSYNLQLIRYTLPSSFAGELWALCRDLGISGSTLFPGFEGVAKDIRDWAKVSCKSIDQSSISLRSLLW